MRFEKSRRHERAGRAAGYAAAYLIFTGMLTLLMILLGKITWGYMIVNVTCATAGISLLGYGLNRYLNT